MNCRINLYGDVEKFYSYRSAVVIPIVLTIEDNESKLWKRVERYLSNQDTPIRMDNHICWKTTTGICMEYSDGKLYIGPSIREGRW